MDFIGKSRSKRLTGELELKDARFTDITDVSLGRWFTARPGPTEPLVCILRTGSQEWHVFYQSESTGSGRCPRSALIGGLGNIIETDTDLAILNAALRLAPSILVDYYPSLRRAVESARATEIHDE